jgi:glyoxylase-like metal-dependent hydrolase (beta-lactamase superfamily II)
LKPPFQTDHTPQVGVPLALTEGLRVITCGNASPMTFTGTQTYLLGEAEVAVIDPGPADPAHLAAIETALEGQTISHIIVTHSHVDHSPLAAILSAKTGAPVYGFGPADAARSKLMSQLAAEGNLGGAEGIDTDFAPDILVADGEEIKGAEWALAAIHTPGHLSNHLCFAWDGNDSLFSGDHVMGWASTLVSPPDGDLTAFMASLKTLQNRPEHTYYAGHGAPLFEAHNMLDYLLAHRLGREDQIMARLQSAPRTVAELTADMYADVNPLLHGAASRNVLAHLIDLFERGLVLPEGVFSADARFKLT